MLGTGLGVVLGGSRGCPGLAAPLYPPERERLGGDSIAEGQLSDLCSGTVTGPGNGWSCTKGEPGGI